MDASHVREALTELVKWIVTTFVVRTMVLLNEKKRTAEQVVNGIAEAKRALQACMEGRSFKVVIGPRAEKLKTTKTVAATKKVMHSFLKPMVSAKLPATEAFDPKELDQRLDIEMSDNMKKCILSVANPIRPLPEGTLLRFGFKKMAYDKQVVSELPDYYVISASRFLSRFAKLTALQPKGKRGTLTTHGSANIVYVYGVDDEVFVADVHWSVHSERWYFTVVCQLGNGPWHIGNQVLVETTDAHVS